MSSEWKASEGAGYNLRRAEPYRWPRKAAGEVSRMAVDRNNLRNVAFLCVDREIDGKTVRKPKATAFFVRVGSATSPGYTWDYCITCRHVIESYPNESIFIRTNRRDGGIQDCETDALDWIKSDEADVAAIPLALPDGVREELDIAVHLPLWCANQNYQIVAPPFEKNPKPIECGDEVYAVGLFVQEYGRTKALPVARFGHIARMPDYVHVPFWKGDQTDRLAYLVEFLSWGGVSGSPVWVLKPHVENWTVKLGGKPVPAVALGNYKAIIGIVTGHKHIKAKVESEAESEDEQDLTVALNSGMAVVTPSHYIVNLLMCEELVAMRKRDEQIVSAGKPATTELDREP